MPNWSRSFGPSRRGLLCKCRWFETRRIRRDSPGRHRSTCSGSKLRRTDCSGRSLETMPLGRKLVRTLARAAVACQSLWGAAWPRHRGDWKRARTRGCICQRLSDAGGPCPVQSTGALRKRWRSMRRPLGHSMAGAGGSTPRLSARKSSTYRAGNGDPAGRQGEAFLQLRQPKDLALRNPPPVL
jgi:hypothetical protein